MMNRFPWHLILFLTVFVAAAPAALAQKQPRIGYVYPAGGQRGGTFTVTVGGQYLDGVKRAIISGGGVQATVAEHEKPLTQKELNQVRQKLQQARKKMQAENKKAQRAGKPLPYKSLAKVALEMGISDEEFKKYNELRKKLTDPKRQPNPQIEETVALQITVAEDAKPGMRELRMLSPAGLTNPLRFQVGQLPEYREVEPNDDGPDAGIGELLPVVVNGQIMPGDVDRFRFEAKKGQRLVVAAAARDLIPYLADAVPGWFQATLALHDSSGKEVSYADDYRFHPDPVLHYVIPEDGQYVLQIKDAIYRGREDFVYRITLGEVPFVTSVFPLGRRNGEGATVEVQGWNLPVDRLKLEAAEGKTGIQPISVGDKRARSNLVPFAVDELPECLEKEPNDDAPDAQKVTAPVIVNGRIGQPGDRDVFRFQARAGDAIVAEVMARRLNSPLDSLLHVTDAKGKQLAVNDDHEDKGAGLTTHHADSRLSVSIPKDGEYYLHLGDTQRQGGVAYGYRLRISPREPDFALRVVPSSISARPGAVVPITVYALLRDGFSEDITLRLKDAPPGFALSGAWVPAGQEKVTLTLTVPPTAPDKPVRLRLDGVAVVDGQNIRRPAVPAEDMMQAFIYRHLVPANSFMVVVDSRSRAKTMVQLLDQTPVQLAAGSTAQVRIAIPKWVSLTQIQLALSEPPPGVAVGKLSSIPEGAALTLRADAKKAKVGLKGNLIVNAFMNRTFKKKDGKPGGKRRIPMGTLPAIPFEIVAPSAANDSKKTPPAR